jgi:hypothetical protein
MRAARTTVTTAASCLTRTSDASSRPSRPKAASPCRRCLAGADGAVQVAGKSADPRVSGLRQCTRRAVAVDSRIDELCGQHRDALDHREQERSS